MIISDSYEVNKMDKKLANLLNQNIQDNLDRIPEAAYSSQESFNKELFKVVATYVNPVQDGLEELDVSCFHYSFVGSALKEYFFRTEPTGSFKDILVSALSEIPKYLFKKPEHYMEQNQEFSSIVLKGSAVEGLMQRLSDDFNQVNTGLDKGTLENLKSSIDETTIAFDKEVQNLEDYFTQKKDLNLELRNLPRTGLGNTWLKEIKNEDKTLEPYHTNGTGLCVISGYFKSITSPLQYVKNSIQQGNNLIKHHIKYFEEYNEVQKEAFETEFKETIKIIKQSLETYFK